MRFATAVKMYAFSYSYVLDEMHGERHTMNGIKNHTALRTDTYGRCIQWYFNRKNRDSNMSIVPRLILCESG